LIGEWIMRALRNRGWSGRREKRSAEALGLHGCINGEIPRDRRERVEEGKRVESGFGRRRKAQG
jgi:hypothetical protein